MALSRPIISALSFYFGQLYEHPIRTKSITSAVIAVSGNYASQRISGAKVLNHQSLLAYGAYALLFGGTIPHYFYEILETIVPPGSSLGLVKRLIIERLIFSPLFQAFSLYTIARLEGKDHDTAVKQMKLLYWPMLSASWKYMTIVQLLNIQFVPAMLRVIVSSLIGFFWIIYLSNKRRQQQAKSKP